MSPRGGNIKRVLGGVVALFMALLWLAIPANASQGAGESPSLSADPPVSDEAFMLGILGSANPEKVVAALPPEQLARAQRIVDKNLQVRTDESRSFYKRLNAEEIRARGIDPALSAAAAGCWTKYWYSEYTMLSKSVGWADIDTSWCGSGGRITSHNKNADGGGWVWTYQGNTLGARDLGWEVRMRASHRWTLGLLGTTNCLQVRGGATGLYSTTRSCTL